MTCSHRGLDIPPNVVVITFQELVTMERMMKCGVLAVGMVTENVYVT